MRNSRWQPTLIKQKIIAQTLQRIRKWNSPLAGELGIRGIYNKLVHHGWRDSNTKLLYSLRPKTIVRSICPARNSRLKVKNLCAKLPSSRSPFRHCNFGGHAFCSSCCSFIWRLTLTTIWSTAIGYLINLATIRNTDNHYGTEGVQD